LQLTGASAGDDFQLVKELSELAPVKETAYADEVCSQLIILLNKSELLLGELFGFFHDGTPKATAKIMALQHIKNTTKRQNFRERNISLIFTTFFSSRNSACKGSEHELHDGHC